MQSGREFVENSAASEGSDPLESEGITRAGIAALCPGADRLRLMIAFPPRERRILPSFGISAEFAELLIRDDKLIDA